MKKSPLQIISRFAFLLILGFSLTGLADDEKGSGPAGLRSEFYLAGGSVRETGYIFDDGSKPGSLEFGFRLWGPARSENKKHGGMWEVSIQGGGRQKTDGSAFPYPQGSSVGYGLFAFVPNFSLISHEHWTWFAGVGPAVLTLSDSGSKNSQDFGVFVWQTGLVYEADPYWSFGWRTQWFKVSETVNSQDYFQEFWTNSLTVAYAPDWMNGR